MRCIRLGSQGNSKKNRTGEFSVCTFGFKGEVAVFADIRASVGVQADVLVQHAGFPAADAALLTHIPPPASSPHVHILLIRPVAVRTPGEVGLSALRHFTDICPLMRLLSQ